ncbi:MAG: sigma-70 family RNA polymerase sigma factor, partial [Pseudonocardiales bacterium]|nr:sigma-70 family RNA polymerase sigma factor [Pseudonocardiales bacterium]
VADLLLRIREGDAAAWDQIIRRYGKLVSMTVRPFRLREADALHAVQMTWQRLIENAHRVQYPERLGGWLATTARRECLHILRQTKLGPETVDGTAETLDDPRELVAELPPDRTLLRMLFPDTPYSSAEVAKTAGTPAGGIGPTRARALRQLRDKLHTHRPSAPGVDAVKGEEVVTEDDRTGSHFLDDLLDRAEQGLREKLEPKVTDLRISSTPGTGDAQLDELLHKADAALRAALNEGHGTTAREPRLERGPSKPGEGRRPTHSGDMQAADGPLTAAFSALPTSERRSLPSSSTAWSTTVRLGVILLAAAGTLIFAVRSFGGGTIQATVLIVLVSLCVGMLLGTTWTFQALQPTFRRQAEERRRLNEEWLALRTARRSATTQSRPD